MLIIIKKFYQNNIFSIKKQKRFEMLPFQPRLSPSLFNSLF